MDLHKRIKALRLKNFLTQADLSNKMSISLTSISCWENGSKKPSTEAIISLAQIFGVSTDYLLGVSEKQVKSDQLLLTPGENRLLSDYRVLDSYGQKTVATVCSLEKQRVESSRHCFAVHKPAHQSARYIPRYFTPSAAGLSVPLDGEDFEMILVDESVPSEADFAVKIQGNSMQPYISDGDVVYVKRQESVDIGEVGIFCVDGAMYCKHYFVDSEQNAILVSANEDCCSTNIVLAEDCCSDVRCYGKVLLPTAATLPSYILEEKDSNKI